MKQPFFSIVITAYNKEKYIKQCIFSVLNQSENDFEIIFADDYSNDNTLSFVQNINDKRVKIIETRSNKGVSYCRNAALKEASGKYILFVDGDDWLNASLLKRAKNELLTNPVDVLFFPYCLFWEEKHYRRISSKFRISRLKKHKKPVDANCAVKDLINTNYEIWNKFFCRDFLLNNDIMFREDLSFSEDLVFYCRVLRYLKKFSYLKECGYFYRSGLNKYAAETVTERIKKAMACAESELTGTQYEKYFKSFASKILNWWIIKLNYSEELHGFACSFCKNQKIININSAFEKLIFKICIRIASVM